MAITRPSSPGAHPIREALAVMEHDRIVEPRDVDTVDGPPWRVGPLG